MFFTARGRTLAREREREREIGCVCSSPHKPIRAIQTELGVTELMGHEYCRHDKGSLTTGSYVSNSRNRLITSTTRKGHTSRRGGID